MMDILKLMIKVILGCISFKNSKMDTDVSVGEIVQCFDCVYDVVAECFISARDFGKISGISVCCI